MRTGLAEAWWARVRDAVEENAQRQSATFNLGQALHGEGKYGKAEGMFREVHGIRMRVLGAEHPQTLLPMRHVRIGIPRGGRARLEARP